MFTPKLSSVTVAANRKDRRLGGVGAPRRERRRIQHLPGVDKRHACDDRPDGRPGKPHVGNHELTCARIEQHAHKQHLKRVHPYGCAQDAARNADGDVAKDNGQGLMEGGGYVASCEHAKIDYSNCAVKPIKMIQKADHPTNVTPTVDRNPSSAERKSTRSALSHSGRSYRQHNR